MKKNILMIVAIMAASTCFSQAVQRNMVILEIATGTWCQYCPGAARGADDLVAGGASVAVIENHNGDPYANAFSDARNTYYNTPGYPDDHFDGTHTTGVGGAACPNGNVYSDYLTLYNTCHATQSPLTIDISGSNSGNDYTIVLSIHKVAAVSGSDLRAMLVLTESNIAVNWQGCMTKVDYVERTMAPDQNGTSFSFASGDMQIIVVTFNKSASWVNSNCELVAFVQDHGSKTIYNGAKVALNSLPAPVPVDFSASPTSGCTPFNVNFSNSSSGVDTYMWDLPGGTPSSPTTQNPSVTYNTAGTYNATLTAWSSSTNRGNKKVRTSYIAVTPSPATPGTPFGATQLCINPPDQSYSALAVPGATSYIWDIQPPSAGVVSPIGNACSVNFDDTFTGTAILKVRGVNTCGEGPWSTGTSINVSLQPGTPGTPTGTTQLCENSYSTDYQTTGTTPATLYTWAITPSQAGSIVGSGTTGTVNWNTGFTGPAQVSVMAANNGCEGPWSSSLAVNVESRPTAFTMTGGGATCATAGTGIAVGLSNSENGINYTLYRNDAPTTTIVPGTGAAISFGNQVTGGKYTSLANNPTTTCNKTMNGFVDVAVDPQVPDAPAQPTGNGTPLPGTITNYTTAGGTYATSYSWDVTPANAGTFSGSTTTGTITWSPTYQGGASIKVQGVNSCGSGSFSIDFPVNVTTGISEPAKQKIVTLYPNPAKGMINIIPLYKVKTDLKVFNSMGAVVMERDNLSLTGTYPLDISTLSPGIYYFNILTNDAQQIQKVIVQ